MAYSNRKAAYADVAYPELQPITRPALQRPAIKKSQYKKKTTRAQQCFYLVINAALLFGVVQGVRTLLSDGMHLSRLMSSQVAVQQFYSQTRSENQSLQHKIKVYSSPSGIEELARNYLNMVGENELPVRFQ